jgi:hypothetical protein
MAAMAGPNPRIVIEIPSIHSYNVWVERLATRKNGPLSPGRSLLLNTENLRLQHRCRNMFDAN